MSKLVEDLLLLSRLDAGQLRLAREVVVLADLLCDVQRQVGRLADARGVRLVIGSVRGAVRGDATRLRQVLLILLDNALRHTPPGGTIQIETHPDGRQIEISVADSGSGVAPEHLPHVFERFFRADSARSDERGGSGLGLSIAKALVEVQQGQIAITSRLGQGTCVTLMLPEAGE
jgi:signal transduction histidine kinase